MQEPKLQPFSNFANSLKAGIYEHYKGNRYQVIGIARNSETLEELVVYKALYGEQELWVRPLSMFCQNITFNNAEMPRFKFISD